MLSSQFSADITGPVAVSLLWSYDFMGAKFSVFEWIPAVADINAVRRVDTYK